MIDMHTHILPGVDDGAETMETAIEMIGSSIKNGTKEILLTPHGNIMGLYENFELSKLRNQYRKLQEELLKRKIGATLHLGMEVFGTYDIEKKIQNHEVLPIGQSKYMLVEFEFEEDAETMFLILKKICEQGFRPIIAHPERYLYMREEELVALKKNGCKFQLNLMSLAGTYGKRVLQRSQVLLKAGFYDFAGSDLHHLEIYMDALSRIRLSRSQQQLVKTLIDNNNLL